jgi:hypothetical protein
MYAGLAIGLIITSLLVGAWCFVAAGRNRWLDLSHQVALALLEVGLLVQSVLALVRLAGGERPEELVTFVGYLITSVVFLPIAVVLSFMERTRWGAVIAGAGAIVEAVLVLRLQQVWTPLR